MNRALALLTVFLLLFSTAFGEGQAADIQAVDILAAGSSGASVRRLQERLRELGLLRGPADGLYGKSTAEAVKAAQQHLISQGQDIRADGIAGPQTLGLMYEDQYFAGLLDLKPGDKGSRVSQLQTQLYDLRLLDTLPDGDFGPKTGEALKAFQEILLSNKVDGAQVSGIADAVTRKALQANPAPLGLRLPQTFDERYPEALTGEDIYARAALLADRESGRVYLDKQGNERLYPASTTKVMTLLIALRMLDPDRIVTIPPEAADVPGDSSLTPVYPGERMPARDLFYGLMLRSGNDAANALAVLCAGSVENFVSLMNKEAQALGLQNTHFVNPHGYHDPEHYMSARDLALLSLHALNQPGFHDIVSRREWTMSPTTRRPSLQIQVNTELFNPDSPHYTPFAWGLKSGYTRAAGFCYVGCLSLDGRELIAVIFNARTRSQGFTDMRRLFRLGLALY